MLRHRMGRVRLLQDALSTAAVKQALPSRQFGSMTGGMNIVVVPHDPAWRRAYEREASSIRHAFEDIPIVLHHIGSTAVPAMAAKPIIDMLGIVDDLETFDRHSDRWHALRYEVLGPFGIEGRRYFRKSGAEGRRTHHLHAYANGSRHIELHLAFRDYLRHNPVKAAEYSDLKAKITSGSGVSANEYMDAKSPFIRDTEKLAIDWYRKNVIDGNRPLIAQYRPLTAP